MAQATIANVINVEIENYAKGGAITTLFDRDDTFYSTIEKRPVEVVGDRDLRIPLEISPNGNSAQYNSDGGDMGVGSGPAFDKALVNTNDFLHRVQWSARSAWVTDDRRKAVVNYFRHLTATSMKEFRRFQDALVTSGGGNGVLGTITAVAANTPVGFDTLTLTTDGFGVNLLRKGQKVQIWKSDFSVERGGANALATISKVDIPNKQIQIPTGVPAGVVATDVIVVEGQPSVAPTPPQSMNGVMYHNNDASIGTWQGFDRATTPEIRGNGIHAGPAALSLPLPRIALNKIADRLGIENDGYKSGRKWTAWTHLAQFQAYENIGQNTNLMRVVKEMKEESLNLYFSGNMQLAGVPMKPSNKWNRTRIDFIDTSNWGRAELKAPDFFKNPEGKKFWELRGASGGLAAAFLFYLVCSWQVFIMNPAATTYIDQLSVPAGY